MNAINYVPKWVFNAFTYHVYPIGFFNAPETLSESSRANNLILHIRNYYDYLKDLGVNLIQFGPLFKSASHGYNTIDYFSLDPRLGTNNDFKTIVAELHSRDIKVIVDGVFNHVGRDFFAFQDVLKNGEHSSYKSWFYLDFTRKSKMNDPFNYKDWEGFASLVKLNVENSDVKKYLFNAIAYWMKEVKIDGWRLDVSYLLPQQFLKELRITCKNINPECLLVGEMIHGEYTRWVGRDLLDSGTSYQIQKSTWSAIESKNMHELKNVLDMNFNSEHGRIKDLYLMNFLGNHDTDRIASVLNKEDLLPAFLLLFTLNGYPKIYYGDEYGMTGKKTKHSDHEVRRPMLSLTEINNQNIDVLNNIKRFAQLRKSNDCLKYGKMISFYADPECFAFVRYTENEFLIIIVSIYKDTISKTIPVNNLNINQKEFYDILNNEDGFKVENNQLKIEKLYYKWGRVLQKV